MLASSGLLLKEASVPFRQPLQAIEVAAGGAGQPPCARADFIIIDPVSILYSLRGKENHRVNNYENRSSGSLGLPEEVAHVADTHSLEGQFVTRSLINTIVYHADHAFWEVLGGAGVLQPHR